jgi:ferrous iron transport protein B
MSTRRVGSSEKSVALIGNPNTGKSSLFNALCGTSARVGNYPGVTVEQKVGRLVGSEPPIDIIDLPGTYSLAARSADEAVTIDVLCGSQRGVARPNAIVVIVDATNLERNLYLLSQVIEFELPVLIVFNMWDRVQQEGHKIDVSALSTRIGLPILCTSASKREGIEQVRQAIIALTNGGIKALDPENTARSSFPAAFLTESESLAGALQSKGIETPRIEVDRMLIDKDGHFQTIASKAGGPEIVQDIEQARVRLESAGCKIPLFETKHRYGWVRQQIAGLVERPPANLANSSDKIDRWLTHRWIGMAFFVLLMFLIFQSITLIAKWPMGWIESTQGWTQGILEQWIAPGAMRSLLSDGVIAGIGAVLIFLPQIAILFLFIAILEDCGYMSRAAFVVDKMMSTIGLSGRSFLPLMSSFACAVPGIMATRTIESVKDRMVTILIAPLMSCSARLPVYILLVSAFVPETTYLGGWLSLQGAVLFAMHCVGALVAIPTAWFLRKFFFPGAASTFLMELHSYKWPSWFVLFQRVRERVVAFVSRAGTLIFCTSILVWAAGYFPGDRQGLVQAQTKLETLTASGDANDQQAIDEATSSINAARRKLIDESFLGMAGKTIEPLVKPLGWDWKIGVAAIASFPAREVIIATLGTIYSLGSEEDESSDSLKDQMKAERWPDGRPVYSLATALSIMVFFALCAQCSATLVTIKRETNSWRWPLFSFVYMTALAYVGAWLTFTIATWLGMGS